MALPSQPSGARQQQAADLQTTRNLLKATLDSSINMIQVFEAVRNEQGELVDFVWILNNHASEKIYGDVVGKSLLQHQPGVVEEGIFAAFKQVVETGVPQQYEKRYVHEQFDGWFHQSVVKLNDGVATTTSDITDRKKAEEQLKYSHAFLQSVIDSSLDIIQVFKAVRDEAGNILDFVWVMNNQKAVVQNGDVIGHSMLKQNPGVVETGIFDYMVQVTQTGVPYEHEQYYAHEQFDGWFYQALVKTDEGVAMTTRDITKQKQAEQEILRLKDEVAQKATDKYESIFNAIDEGFCIYELVYNDKGQPIDLQWVEVNPAYQKQTGLNNVVGKLHSDIGLDTEKYWYDIYDQVAKTGEPVHFENWHEPTKRWYHIYTSRIGGADSRQVAVVFNDITERKQRERQQEFLIKISDALRSLSDPIAMQRATLSMLREYFGSSRTLYAEALDQSGTMKIITESRDLALPPMEGLVFQFSDFTPEALQEALAGWPLWREDVFNEEHTPEQQAGYVTLGTRSWLMTPLVKEGRLVAEFTIHHGKPRKWTSEEIALVQEIIERTWAAVERARVEEALKQREKELARVQQIGHIGGVEINVENHLTRRCSPEYILLHGLPVDTQTETHDDWLRRLHPDDRYQAEQALWIALQGAQSSYENEYRIIRPNDGRLVWIYVKLDIERNADEKPVRLVGVHIDITSRKLAQEALKEADRRKDEFLAMLAHELRNPMAPIRNGLQLLTQTHGQDQMLGTMLPILNRQMDHLMRMVDDLLDVSRISRGKIELRKQRIDLTKVVRQAVEAMQPLYRSSGRQLSPELPPVPLYLDGDATRLHQVVTNLLTNGLRYTNEGGQVWITLEPLDGQALLRVRDNGIGLAADQLTAIFELFVQVDTSLARSHGGLGLGLTLVRELVAMHGGRVEAYSPGLEQGSEFLVYLPTQLTYPSAEHDQSS